MESERLNNHMPCLRCGNCCSRYQVLLEPGEMQRIAYYLKMTPEAFLERFADTHWPISDKCLIRQLDDACAFLYHEKQQALCSIHTVKPKACCDWSPGLSRRECREGLESSWHLSVSAEGKVEGSETDWRRLQEFLDGLDREL